MSWKAVHRWLGLTLGTVAVVLGITGALLAIDPVQQAWQAPAAASDLTVATLVERVTRTVPAAEEIRRLPSGAVVVFSFAGDQPQASYIDPATGQVLGAWQASVLPRWVKNLHRSLLLGDAGRWGAAVAALVMAVLWARSAAAARGPGCGSAPATVRDVRFHSCHDYKGFPLILASDPPIGSHPLENGGDTLAAANAHGHERITAIDALQLVQGLDGNERAGGADRVTQ